MPKIFAEPLCGGTSVERTRKSVVFPLPLGPSSATISPALTDSDNSCSAVRPPS